MNTLEAYDFLQSLQARLNDSLPGPKLIKAQVSARWDKPKSEKSPQEQLACKENIFLYHFALPVISKHVISFGGLDTEQARIAVRCEYYSKFPQLSSANAHRALGHPFGKHRLAGSKDVF